MTAAAEPLDDAVILSTRNYQIRWWARILPSWTRTWLFQHGLEWVFRYTVSKAIYAHLPTCGARYGNMCFAYGQFRCHCPCHNWL
jgi:hypothetical protein